VMAGVALDVRVNGARMANLIEELYVNPATRDAAVMAMDFTDEQITELVNKIGNPSIERLREILTDPDLLAFVEMLPYEYLVALADALRGESLMHLENALIINIDLEGTTHNINYHRLVAVDAYGNIMQGRYNAITGQFIFEVHGSGIYEVIYIETLRRVIVDLHSYTLTDPAQEVEFTMDVLPVVQNGRTLLPIRFMAYVLGAEVDWSRSTAYAPLTVILTLYGKDLHIPVGVITPDLAILGMDVPAVVIDGRTMVPLRFVGEFFGALVNWERDARRVEIIGSVG